MQYWVIKANPAGYDYDKKLRPGREENWHSKFPPEELAAGDRLFLWESRPYRRLVGFGVVVKPIFKIDEEGGKVFRAKYLTYRLNWMPPSTHLREIAAFKNASFLRPGVIRTVYPLTPSQARELYQITIAGNPTDDIWKEISGEPSLTDSEASAMEGSLKLITHLRKERSPQLARQKKAQFRQEKGKLFCEACESDWPLYGKLKSDIFEVHHRRPLSTATGPVNIHLKDLAVLCPNCHRAIHRTDPMLTVEALSKRYAKNSRLKK